MKFHLCRSEIWLIKWLPIVKFFVDNCTKYCMCCSIDNTKSTLTNDCQACQFTVWHLWCLFLYDKCSKSHLLSNWQIRCQSGDNVKSTRQHVLPNCCQMWGLMTLYITQYTTTQCVQLLQEKCINNCILHSLSSHSWSNMPSRCKSGENLRGIEALSCALLRRCLVMSLVTCEVYTAH